MECQVFSTSTAGSPLKSPGGSGRQPRKSGSLAPSAACQLFPAQPQQLGSPGPRGLGSWGHLARPAGTPRSARGVPRGVGAQSKRTRTVCAASASSSEPEGASQVRIVFSSGANQGDVLTLASLQGLPFKLLSYVYGAVSLVPMVRARARKKRTNCHLRPAPAPPGHSRSGPAQCACLTAFCEYVMRLKHLF